MRLFFIFYKNLHFELNVPTCGDVHSIKIMIGNGDDEK